MDVTFKQKRLQFGTMLKTFEQAIIRYSQQCKTLNHLDEDDALTLSMSRDSVIQRHEYCVDGFWKIIKLYLENIAGLPFTESGRKPIIRMAALQLVITESESAHIITMINERNKTSHIYKEEIADEIAKQAPRSLELMQTIFDRLNRKIDGN